MFDRIIRDWWLYFIAICIPTSIVASWYISSFLPIGFFDFIQVIGLIGPILLTLVLAFLYRELTIVNYDQKEIMENQVELMKSNHEPEIQVDRVGVSKIGKMGENFVLYLSNVGKGTAVEITAKISVEPVPETDLDIEFPSIERKLIRNEEESNEDGEFFKNIGSYLRPNENLTRFSCGGYIKYNIDDGGSGRTAINQLLIDIASSYDIDILFANDKDEEVEFEDNEEEEHTFYEVSFPESDGKIWTVISDEDVEKYRSLGAQISRDEDFSSSNDDDVSKKYASKNLMMSRAKEIVDFEKIRLNIDIQYSNARVSNKKETNAVDRVIHIGTYAPSEYLYSSSKTKNEYEDRHFDGIKWGIFKKLVNGNE